MSIAVSLRHRSGAICYPRNDGIDRQLPSPLRTHPRPHVNPAIETSTGTIMISTDSRERVARNGDTQTPLCDVDAHGEDVLATLPVILEVGAVADLDGVINRVESASRATRHEVKVLADVADLVAASAVEIECPKFAGVVVGVVRWCAIVMAVNLLVFRLAG